MNPLDLEWGSATPEFMTGDASLAVHVFNHSLENDDQLEKNLAFIKARADFFRSQLPDHTKQHIIFDDRGQKLPDPVRQALRDSIEAYATLEFMTEKP